MALNKIKKLYSIFKNLLFLLSLLSIHWIMRKAQHQQMVKNDEKFSREQKKRGKQKLLFEFFIYFFFFFRLRKQKNERKRKNLE